MNPEITNESSASLYMRIAEAIETARRHVAQTANLAMVMCYYQIGRMIVEDEQKGRPRAEYGEKTLQALSKRLTERFGKGFPTGTCAFFASFTKPIPPTLEMGNQRLPNCQMERKR